MKRDNHRLQIEFLESRVMLAGGDDASRVAALASVETAVLHGGDYVDVELMEYERVLKITGSGQGNVTIDLSELPDSVVNLQISSFTTVTLIGEHKVDYLMLTDIQKVDAGRISIGQSLWAYGVEHVRIDTTPALVFLQGSSGYGSVGDKTLLEVNRFSSDPQASILAWVENFGLATSSHVESLPKIGTFASGSVLLNFQPAQQPEVAEDVTLTLVQGVDFNRYFFASPSERTAFDKSHVVTRDLAVTHVALSTLLNNPAIRAALAEFSEGGQESAAPPIRLLDAEFSGDRPGTTTLRVDFHDFATETSAADSRLREQQAVLFPIENFRTDAAFAVDAPGDDTSPTPEFESRMALDGAQMRFQSIDESAEADSRNAHTPQDAFDRMITGIREQLTTFGEMMTDELNEHLRSDGQMALLADTRLSRTRAVQDFLVINV